jgi:hypothetical protein
VWLLRAGSEQEKGEIVMLTIELNMYHAVALGAFLFWMGGIITDKVRLLNRYCIPAPLVGGLCFSILNCILYSAGIASITFDGTLQTVFMILFFTTVGFTVSIPALLKGGKAVVLCLIVANLITLLLGITISFSMRADQFVNRNTLIIMGFGLVAFVFDSIAGVMFAKLLNLFSKKKVNPMVGAAGISAFPMSARVIQKMGLEADPQNHLLMHAVGANVAGQIASVLAGGMILNLVPQLLK